MKLPGTSNITDSSYLVQVLGVLFGLVSVHLVAV